MFYDSNTFFGPWSLFMGRHPGGRGFGRFKGGFMGGGPGGMGAGFRTGRKLAGTDLQLLILALLADKPSHGYEIIKALEERSAGFYCPSPGMIYPALTYLEEIGHVTVEAAGAKKLYHITPDGQKYLDQNRAMADMMLSQLEQIGGKMERVRRAFSDDDPAANDEGEEAFDLPVSGELHQARRALRMALRQKRHSSPEEAGRIAEILRRAINEILGN